MGNNDTESGGKRRLAAQIKAALLREAMSRHMVTPQQFSQIMELQRDR